MRRRIRTFLTLTCVSLAGCISQQPPATPDALIVLPRAQHVHRGSDNLGSVAYDLDEPYPAAKTMAAIRSHLEATGWRPFMPDFLNPDLPSSLSRGWTYHEDGTRPERGDVGVHQWLAQWQDASGRVVVYRLAYEVPADPRTIPEPKGPLHIVSTLISAETAQAMRAAAVAKP